MSLIQVIPASTEVTFNVQNIYEFVQIGAIGSNPVADLTVIISGKQRITATASLLKTINGIGMAGQGASGVVVANVTQVANGGKGNEQVQITVNNTVATPVNVYGFSTSVNNGTCVVMNESSVVANSNDTYEDFEALAFGTANFDNAQIEFADGWSDRLSLEELKGLLAKLTPALSLTDLVVAGFLAIDNRLGFIKSIKIYANSGGAINVLSKTYELI
jgi:hypothetical protein